jgi:serine/threonine-protein kinase
MRASDDTSDAGEKGSGASPSGRSAEAQIPRWLLQGLACPPAPRAPRRAPEARIADARIPGFELLDVLGSGSWADVFRARNEKLGRVVALKVLRARGPESAHALLREAQRGSIEHENIARLYSVGEDHGYLEMELVAGRTLRELLQGAPIGLADALGIGEQIAAGLAATHRRGIIHRDLSHNNVMVTDDGRVKILDFGLAKARDQAPRDTSAQALGTLGFRSPEQAAGGPLDERSDVYAFGCILARLLDAAAGEGASEAHAALAPVVARSTMEAPADRYADAGEIVAALAAARRALLAAEAVPIPIPGTPPRAGTGRAARLAAGFALLAAGAVAVSAALSRAARPPPPAEAAEHASVVGTTPPSAPAPSAPPAPLPAVEGPAPAPTTLTGAPPVATSHPRRSAPTMPARRRPGDLDPRNPY